MFGLAALTDWLDGYLARRLKQTTRFGAFLDPVADKLVVVSAIVMMVGDRASLWLTLPGLVIVGREIVVSALREWMAEMNRRGVVAVGLSRKDQNRRSDRRDPDAAGVSARVRSNASSGSAMC